MAEAFTATDTGFSDAGGSGTTPKLLMRGGARGGPGRSARWHLAGSLRRQLAERIALTAATMGCLDLLSVTISLISFAVGTIDRAELVLNARLGLVIIPSSFALALVARRRWMSRTWLVVCWGVYLFLLSGVLTWLEFTLYPHNGSLRGISWVCILLFSTQITVPMTLLLHTLVATSAALSGPIVALLFLNAGLPLPKATELLRYFAPIIAAGIIGVSLGALLNDLRQAAEKAVRHGAYRLSDKLGQGGMGEVWLATHELLARPVALKLIRADRLVLPKGRRERVTARFEREAKLTAQLTAAQTVKLYDFGISDDGTFFYVMELLDGLSLDVLINRHGPQSPSRTAFILEQACLSLAEAHAFGLVHRDIKPANLMVCPGPSQADRVKVLDFGLVKGVGDEVGRTSAVPSKAGKAALRRGIAGTPSFIPPEQVSGSRDIDGRADLYGLACVAYWLLSGRRVFECASAAEYFERHLFERPLPLAFRAEQDVPAPLEAIVMRCLEKDPAARPASALELFRALRATGLSEAWTPYAANAWWRDALGSRRRDTPATAEPPGLRTLTLG